MVFCISTYRTWIEVADGNPYKEHVVPRNSRTDFLVSRTPVLRIYRPHGTYNQGITWTILKHGLDTTLAIYRKQNDILEARVKEGALSLTAEDVKVIIRSATHEIVHLRLVVQSVHIPPEPYYLL